MAECDGGGYGEHHLPMRAEVDQTNTSNHFMRAPLQFGQKAMSLLQVARFAKHFRAQGNNRVRSKDEGVGMFLCNGAGLTIGVHLANLSRCQVLWVCFGSISRNHLEVEL